jgi:alkylation response protein AidB-like acyl-CoA dehydrogenase
MNILGAMGVSGLSLEASLEELYRDICMLSIHDGMIEIFALIHGRELTGLGAFHGSTRA